MEDDMTVLGEIRSNTRCIVCAQNLDKEKTHCKAFDSSESEKIVASSCDDDISLVSVLLTCLADNSEHTNTNNLHNFHGKMTDDSKDLLYICKTCEKNLVEFEKLSKEVVLLNRRLRALKYTVIAKFTSAAENQDDKNAGENLPFTHSKLEKIRKRLRREFIPNVMLENLSPSQLVSVRVSTEWDAVGGEFTEHKSDDDYWPSDISCDPETESNTCRRKDGEPSGSIRKKKRYLKCKQVGLNEFLYAEKFKISFDGVKYSCGLCSSSLSKKNTMVTHIRKIHMLNRNKCNNRKDTSTKLTAPNEFLYNGKYPFKYLPAQQTYSCGLCEYQNDNLHCMYPHIRTKHYTIQDKQEFTAVQVSENEYLYMGKYRILFKDGKYTCGICSLQRFNLQELYGHIKSRHTDAEAEKINPELVHSKADVTVEVTNDVKYDFKCKGIPYSYDGLSRKFTCGVCSASVGHRTSMLAHIKTFHTGLSLQYICEVCGDSFRGERSLRRRQSRHGPPKYNCQHCGKIFRRGRSFKSHVALHELGEEAKAYQCEYCGKRFSEKKHLNTHVRIHTGEKPYKCDLCDEMFADTARVFYHKKTVHGIAPKKKFD